MYRSILVPIDISETDVTRQVIPQVEAHAKPQRSIFSRYPYCPILRITGTGLLQ